MKKLAYITLIPCFILFAFLFKANAASTATVAATVTLQNISVSVSDGTIAYGTLSSSSSKSTTPADLNDLQTATNNGNITEDFNIKGQNTAAWTLAGSAGSEQYVHKFCTASCTTPPTNYTALTTSYQTLGTSIAASGTKTFDLQITTPSSTATYTQQSVDVIVQAVAP
ncbi:hypothetical protein HYV31_03605 [candidate division WWE3 bacterium]|nr:hypothetical protein [candidate division WWE3 bacterium]